MFLDVLSFPRCAVMSKIRMSRRKYTFLPGRCRELKKQAQSKWISVTVVFAWQKKERSHFPNTSVLCLTYNFTPLLVIMITAREMDFPGREERRSCPLMNVSGLDLIMLSSQGEIRGSRRKLLPSCKIF